MDTANLLPSVLRMYKYVTYPGQGRLFLDRVFIHCTDFLVVIDCRVRYGHDPIHYPYISTFSEPRIKVLWIKAHSVCLFVGRVCSVIH